MMLGFYGEFLKRDQSSGSVTLDCPESLGEKEVKKPRAGFKPLMTHGMNMRGQVDLVDMQSLGNETFRFLTKELPR